jgi:hypothetical protein
LNWVLLSLLLTAGEADGRPVDFDTQIEPLLTRYGCNAGSCHGAAAGRGGFSLSLYGSVPERDYAAIVQQLEGRRVNLSRPDESLLFLKATESIAHGGGPRFDSDSEAAALLLRWIRQGAPRTNGGSAAERKLRSLLVAPDRLQLEAAGDPVRLSVIAAFADGSTRDVTTWSVLTADDPSALEVTQEGQVTGSRFGRHLLTVRFLDRLVPVEVVLPFPEGNRTPPIQKATDNVADSSQPGALIDREVGSRLVELRLPVAGNASPDAFLRRASLRVTGRLPTDKLRDRFLATIEAIHGDSRQRPASLPFASRAVLIDELLGSSAFNDFWTFQFLKLLKVRSQPQSEEIARTAYKWLRQQIVVDRPFDEFARELITATGHTRTNGATAFYLAAGDARQQAEFASELFLGVRLRCANCHDHPLDRWTQDDYHGLAAVFAPVRRGASISVGSSGNVVHPRTGEPAVRKLPANRFLTEGEDGISTFADWVTSNDNGWFDRAIVNRVWKLLMGRGLVEPVDDLRTSNAPTHPQLLEELAVEFAREGRRLKPLIRTICLSQTFARSSVPVRSDLQDSQFYSHALAIDLEPEVLVDAIAEVTGAAAGFPSEVSSNGRAVGLFARNIESETLDLLGRRPVDAECSSSGANAEPLPRALLLINGGFLNDQLAASSGTLSQLLASNASNRELISSCYRRALTRQPTDNELAFWEMQFNAASDETQRRMIAEDFLWAMLTCQEFVTCR